MKQPAYIEDASYRVLDCFKKKNEVIEPITLAIIGIILIVAFFAFKDCLTGALTRQRNLSKLCQRPPMLAQWTMRRIIAKNTRGWSYADRRRLFEAVWQAGARAKSEEIEALFYQVQQGATNDKFIQECLKKQ